MGVIQALAVFPAITDSANIAGSGKGNQGVMQYLCITVAQVFGGTVLTQFNPRHQCRHYSERKPTCAAKCEQTCMSQQSNENLQSLEVILM